MVADSNTITPVKDCHQERGDKATEDERTRSTTNNNSTIRSRAINK